MVTALCVICVMCLIELASTIIVFLNFGDPRVIPPGWAYECPKFAEHLRGMGLLGVLGTIVLDILFFPGYWLFCKIRQRAHINQIRALAHLKEQERQHT